VPSPYGAPAAAETLSTIAAPLLGGFSVALAGVVMQADEAFRFPGVALLLLSIATVLLLLCVQCGFWARHHFATPDQMIAWWRDYEASPQRQRMVVLEQRRSYDLYKRWAGRARRAYRYGILAFMAGIMVTLVPEGTGWQPRIRWAAVAVMGAAVVAEVLWMASASPRLRRRLPQSLANWFVPQP
jgi:hypothetical protein